MRIFSFFITVIALFLPVLASAQTGTLEHRTVTPECRDVYAITGPSAIKMNTSHEYSLSTRDGTPSLPFGTFTLTGGQKPVLQSLEREHFVYAFSEEGEFLLTAQLDPQVHQCHGKISQKIDVYGEQITYIGRERPDIFNDNWKKNLAEKGVLLESFVVDTPNRLEEDPRIAASISSADILVINAPDILATVSQIERIQRLKQQTFSKARVFIISPQPRAFLSKVLASSVAKMGINKVFLINNDQLSSLLSHWSSEEDRSATAGEELSYEKKSFVFSLSSALDYLVYKGISYQFVGFLLVLSVVALLCNVLKQIVGMDVFMLYYPILLGIIFSQLGLELTFLFILIAIISLILVRLLTSRIQLLINAKKSFLISVYILLLFLTIGVVNLFDWQIFEYSILSTPMTLVAIFAVLFIVEKILDNIKGFSYSAMKHLLQYSVIVLIVVGILSWKSLQYFMISYPDVIFLVVIANLLVGRYTGLQIAEYFRFSPILASISHPFRNLHEEE